MSYVLKRTKAEVKTSVRPVRKDIAYVMSMEYMTKPESIFGRK
jgi:hypothetical protein